METQLLNVLQEKTRALEDTRQQHEDLLGVLQADFEVKLNSARDQLELQRAEAEDKKSAIALSLSQTHEQAMS